MEPRFERGENGDVLLHIGGETIRIDKNHWCSIIAQMSFYGEEDMGFYRAANFHYGMPIHETCRLGMKDKTAPESWKDKRKDEVSE